jgi:hypothetical protein
MRIKTLYKKFSLADQAKIFKGNAKQTIGLDPTVRDG